MNKPIPKCQTKEFFEEKSIGKQNPINTRDKEGSATKFNLGVIESSSKKEDLNDIHKEDMSFETVFTRKDKKRATKEHILSSPDKFSMEKHNTVENVIAERKKMYKNGKAEPMHTSESQTKRIARERHEPLITPLSSHCGYIDMSKNNSSRVYRDENDAKKEDNHIYNVHVDIQEKDDSISENIIKEGCGSEEITREEILKETETQENSKMKKIAKSTSIRENISSEKKMRENVQHEFKKTRVKETLMEDILVENSVEKNTIQENILREDKSEKKTTVDARKPHKEDRKVSNRMLSEWLEKEIHFSYKISMIEKERTLTLVHSKNDLKREFMEINSELQKYEESRKSGAELRKYQLKELRHHLRQVKKAIMRCMVLGRENPSQDYEFQIKNLIEEFENELGAFKKQQITEYNELLRQEHLYDREISQFSRLFDSWDKENDCDCKSASDIMLELKNTKNDMPFRVNELSDRVSKIGKALDQHKLDSKWHEKDEKIFNSLLKRVGLFDEDILDSMNTKKEQRLELLVEKAAVEISTKSESSIRSHFNWYRERLKLLKERQQTIEIWKDHKKKEKEKAKLLAQEQEQLLAQQQIQDKADKNSLIKRKKKKNAEIVKQQLAQWKAEQEQKKIKKIENEKHDDHPLDGHEQQRRLIIKQKLAIYHLEKEQEINRKKQLEQRESEFLKKSHRKDIKALYERDIQMIKEKQKKRNIQKAKMDSVVTDLKQHSYIPRDPMRLVKPTHTSLARTVTREDIDQVELKRNDLGAHESVVPSAVGASHARGLSYGSAPIQPRAIPSWRKGI